jgi:transcriptional regulator with XRE-family HTH domain
MYSMVERILSFIKMKGLSPSQFADEIGVQRSGISHLISGRNKPSLEFIQRIVARYPDINLQWILNGTGTMMNNENDAQEMNFTPEQSTTAVPEPGQEEFVKTKKQKVSESVGKQVEKIVVFFKDKTFREYYPE